MKRYVFVLLSIYLCLSCLHAETGLSADLFEKANKHYHEKEYTLALQIYQRIIERNKESADLYFNMGNTHFRLGQYPSAILYYEKALKLNPSFSDAKSNLVFTNSRIVDQFEVLPELIFVRYWKNFVHLLTMDSWAIICLFALTSLLAFLFIYAINKKYSVRKSVFFLSIFFFLVCSLSFLAAWHQYKLSNMEAGIIFEKICPAKSSPEADGKTQFMLHEGCKVYIKDAVGEYYKIRLINGNQAWINKDALELI